MQVGIGHQDSIKEVPSNKYSEIILNLSFIFNQYFSLIEYFSITTKGDFHWKLKIKPVS